MSSSTDIVQDVVEIVHDDAASTTEGELGDIGEERMVWMDSGKNVGIRVLVKERRSGRDLPLLISRDEDVAVSYAIEFEGKEAQLL